MKKYSGSFKQAKVLVLGDIFLDRYWKCNSDRVSREAPILIVKQSSTHDVPGGAANVAMNIANLGVPVTMIGFIGNDDAGTCLENIFKKNNINTQLVKLDKFPTITKLRIISQQQQLIRVDFEEVYDETISYQPILDILEEQIPQHKALILSDYNRGTLRHINKIIEIANKYKIPVIIDPKGDDFSIYTGATMITPNMQEFETIVGKCNNEEDIIKKGIQLIEEIKLDYILVTRSEKGMLLLSKDDKAFKLATEAKEVYDVTGAGDTVIALMGIGFAEQLDVKESCYLSNNAAGIVVSKMGTSTVSLKELNNNIIQDTFESNILNEEELIRKVQEAKMNGLKVVMTNGCFDILHVGHITYLEKASKLGNKLIVAVNTDKSVKALKGSTRPYNTVEDRMKMLAALKSVDWVVPFSEETPDRLISRVLPDILVKGGDYELKDIIGYQHVINNGGEVKSLCFIDNKSTTQLIEKIQKNTK